MSILAHLNKTVLKKSKYITICLLILVLIGCSHKSDAPQPDIAVANSYLNAAIKDLCGVNEQVFDLVPPGMCPGHFDIKPSQVNTLSKCRMMFLFDFQQNIEKAVPSIKEHGLKVCLVVPEEGLCVPETYMSIAQQVADFLSAENPQMQTQYSERLRQMQGRLDRLHSQVTASIKEAGLNGCSVITSQHQKVFAEWLGLNVISTLTGRDSITPAQINEVIRSAQDSGSIKYIIANKQEGTELAEALAERLNAEVIVFSNFPDLKQTSDLDAYDFDNLTLSNVQALVKAVR